MRILITGANGFLGSHVAERLQRRGHDLRLMLRSTSDTSYLAELGGYERRNADLRDAASLAPVVEGIETVVHLGGVTFGRSEADYQAANGAGTAHLAQAALRAGVRRFVYVSSLAAHGPSPSPEPRPQTAPACPVTAYGRSKLAGELAVLAHKLELETAIVRPAAVYGPRDRALLPLYRAGRLGVLPVLGDGMNLASFVYIDDAAEAIALLTEKPTHSGSVYALEDGTPYTWLRLVQAFERATGRKVRVLGVPPWLYKAAGYAGGLAASIVRKPLPLSPEKITHISQRYWVCDSDATRRDLGWQAAIGIDEGMQRTITWCRARGWF